MVGQSSVLVTAATKELAKAGTAGAAARRLDLGRHCCISADFCGGGPGVGILCDAGAVVGVEYPSRLVRLARAWVLEGCSRTELCRQSHPRPSIPLGRHRWERGSLRLGGRAKFGLLLLRGVTVTRRARACRVIKNLNPGEDTRAKCVIDRATSDHAHAMHHRS